MCITSHLIPSTCRQQCVVLNRTKGDPGSDPTLPIAHLPCAWRVVQSYARGRVQIALATLKLGRLARKIRMHAGSVKCRSAEGARQRLANDPDLVEDMLQEVLIALFQAAARGKLNAAVPAIFKWVKNSAWRIVRNKSRAAAFIALCEAGGAAAAEDDGDMLLDEAPVGPDGARLSQELDADEREELLRRLALDPELLERINADRREVLVRWLDGRLPGEIARELGISRVAASLRLMRAKQQLAA